MAGLGGLMSGAAGGAAVAIVIKAVDKFVVYDNIHISILLNLC